MSKAKQNKKRNKSVKHDKPGIPAKKSESNKQPVSTLSRSDRAFDRKETTGAAYNVAMADERKSASGGKGPCDKGYASDNASGNGNGNRSIGSVGNTATINRPKTSRSANRIVTEELMVNVGPQHPSTHGVFRAVVTVDGEVVTKVDPHIGYLHRCFEKIAENRTYAQFMPYTDRLDYISAMLSNWAYALAVEKLAGIEVPERAEYLRVIMGEFNRITSHLIYYSTTGMDTGALTPFFWLFEDREKILDLFEDVCGARQSFNYMRIGGVSADIPDGWIDRALKFFEYFEGHMVDLETILIGNSIFKQRMIGVGEFPSKAALRMGATGPCIRATGVPADVRRTDPYSIYDRFEFDIPVGKRGDNYDRTVVRFEEIRQSIRIIKQALERIPDGPIIAEGIPRLLCPPEGSAFAHIESSKGDLGFLIVSDGGPKPYRLKIQGPSFANLQAFPAIAKNSYVADMITILGTLDPVFGEVDR
jgi:NADH-quinone oxidoreductase subunit D